MALAAIEVFNIFLSFYREPIKVVKMCLRLAFVNEAIVERSWRGGSNPK